MILSSILGFARPVEMVLRLRFSDSSDFSMRSFVSDSTDAAETGDPSSSSLLDATWRVRVGLGWVGLGEKA